MEGQKDASLSPKVLQDPQHVVDPLTNVWYVSEQMNILPFLHTDMVDSF